MKNKYFTDFFRKLPDRLEKAGLIVFLVTDILVMGFVAASVSIEHSSTRTELPQQACIRNIQSTSLSIHLSWQL